MHNSYHEPPEKESGNTEFSIEAKNKFTYPVFYSPVKKQTPATLLKFFKKALSKMDSLDEIITAGFKMDDYIAKELLAEGYYMWLANGSGEPYPKFVDMWDLQDTMSLVKEDIIESVTGERDLSMMKLISSTLYQAEFKDIELIEISSFINTLYAYIYVHYRFKKDNVKIVQPNTSNAYLNNILSSCVYCIGENCNLPIWVRYNDKPIIIDLGAGTFNLNPGLYDGAYLIGMQPKTNGKQ